MLAWGVDVGGTDCKVGVVDGTGQVRAESGFETPDEPEAAVREIERACRALAEELGARIDRLGIGVPGPLDLERGVIVQAPNLGCMKGIGVDRVEALVRARIDQPVPAAIDG